MTTLDARTLAVLSNVEISKESAGFVVRIHEKLDRPVYMCVNNVLNALGGSWNRKLKGHLFEDDPTDKIESALNSGSFVDLKREYDFFETPRPVIDLMMKRAGLSSKSISFLEPSAGRGAILKAVDAFCSPLITAVEINPENVKYLRSNGFTSTIEGDFLSMQPEKFCPSDVILMNPPFSKQQDIDHVMHAYRFLGRKGVLVSVMSASVMFRTNKKTNEFNEWLEFVGGTKEYLPDGSFKESGTNVRTTLVVIGG